MDNCYKDAVVSASDLNPLDQIIVGSLIFVLKQLIFLFPLSCFLKKIGKVLNLLGFFHDWLDVWLFRLI